jgi:glucosylglycerate synthase
MTTTNPIPGPSALAQPPAAHLLVLTWAVTAEELEAVLAGLAETFPPDSIIVAAQNQNAESLRTPLRVVPAPPSGATRVPSPADFVNAFDIAREHDLRAVVMLGPSANSLSALALRGLAEAVLNASTDLAMPLYTLPPNTGLINSAILYPLTRALFAARARFPMALDLAFSARMAERLAAAARRTGAANPNDAILWPVNEAVAAGFSVDEVDVGPREIPQPAESDINAILAFITGSLFSDIEAKAAVWQRPRRPPALRRISAPAMAAVSEADVAHMVEAFRLASANLQEIWSLVLPPQTLVMLKRFSVVEPAAFRMPENLWARIVFDFLIAYRLRTINRGHLLGALIPLYLGWVASHINVTASGVPPERHIEAVASAFEADKPYLVARWRWPDRFNA